MILIDLTPFSEYSDQEKLQIFNALLEYQTKGTTQFSQGWLNRELKPQLLLNDEYKKHQKEVSEKRRQAINSRWQKANSHEEQKPPKMIGFLFKL